MKLISIELTGWMLASVLASASTAAALSVPHQVRKPRVEPHLSLPHHGGAAHHAASHSSAKAAAPAAKSSQRAEAKAEPRAEAKHTGKAARSAKGRAAVAAAAVPSSPRLRRAALKGRKNIFLEHFTASSFASGDLAAGDVTAGEDPIVRQAALDALGDMNGTAVVINPTNGRILAMVNQKLALSPGAEPCSTIKITVAMAALSEGLVTNETMVPLDGFKMNMNQALAKSNNLYFEALGRQLGFERLHRYESMFGLGELAGYNIEGEQLGSYPAEEIAASQGGVGRMCSFGQGISLTPLQLGAFVTALANGGTLYYLQHPTTPDAIAHFEPKVKRQLDIARFVPQMEEGMAGAVEYGTARRLRANFQQFPVFGKTGTCSDKGTRFGWFASFVESPQGPLVTVFFLEGGRPTFGPRAAELTGLFYKGLQERDYFKTEEAQAGTANGVKSAISIYPQQNAGPSAGTVQPALQ